MAALRNFAPVKNFPLHDIPVPLTMVMWHCACGGKVFMYEIWSMEYGVVSLHEIWGMRYGGWGMEYRI